MVVIIAVLLPVVTGVIPVILPALLPFAGRLLPTLLPLLAILLPVFAVSGIANLPPRLEVLSRPLAACLTRSSPRLLAGLQLTCGALPALLPL
jgi:hypothetical protein